MLLALGPQLFCPLGIMLGPEWPIMLLGLVRPRLIMAQESGCWGHEWISGDMAQESGCWGHEGISGDMAEESGCWEMRRSVGTWPKNYGQELFDILRNFTLHCKINLITQDSSILPLLS